MIAFGSYFLFKIRRGVSEPIYGRFGVQTLGINTLTVVKVSKTPDVV